MHHNHTSHPITVDFPFNVIAMRNPSDQQEYFCNAVNLCTLQAHLSDIHLVCNTSLPVLKIPCWQRSSNGSSFATCVTLFIKLSVWGLFLCPQNCLQKCTKTLHKAGHLFFVFSLHLFAKTLKPTTKPHSDKHVCTDFGCCNLQHVQ